MLQQYLIMKLGTHSKCSVIGKFVTLMVIGVLVPGSANPIWDFTKPTNNVAQAAVGGLALGAAGALALSYLKGSGGRSRSRGHYGGNYGWGRKKRDTNQIVRYLNSITIFILLSEYYIFSTTIRPSNIFLNFD